MIVGYIFDEIYFGMTSLMLSYISIYRIRVKDIDINWREICFLGVFMISYINAVRVLPICVFDYFRLIYFSEIIFAVSFIDYKTNYVYDCDLIGGILIQVGIFIVFILCVGFDFSWMLIIAKKILPSVILTLSFGYLFYRMTNGIGDGDILYFSLCASFFGVSEIIIFFEISFLAALIFCLPKIIIDRSISGMIAFTPFISISFVLSNFLFNIGYNI